MVNNLVIIERDLNNFPCPTIEEMTRFLSDFDYFDKFRVLFELQTLSGARIGEIIKAKVQEFSDDFSIWKYRIQKPTITIKYSVIDGDYSTVLDYKVRQVQLPPWFASKLKQYFEINKYSIDAGYLFYNRNHCSPHISRAQCMNILVKKRRKLGLNRVWKEVLKQNKKTGKITRQKWFCIATHSFRRFYITEMYDKMVRYGVDNALVMVGKMLGHETPMKTTSLYLSPRIVSGRAPKIYDPEFLEKIQNAET